MITLDQRILIHSSPDKVWAHISTIANNARWQIGCTQVSFLTSLRKGPGVRWRCTASNGRESIIETTTWYDRVGYEYTYVDGGPFKDCSGILRIQDTPDGTVIQWILNYEPSGVFGGLRNSLRTQRKLEAVMAESLRNLWTFIKEHGEETEEETDDITYDITYHSPTLMRDKPSVEQRSTYKPRHGSAGEGHTTTREISIVEIPEPPLTEDDTRPRPAIANAEQLSEPAANVNVVEPDFLPDLDTESQFPAEAADVVQSITPQSEAVQSANTMPMTTDVAGSRVVENATPTTPVDTTDTEDLETPTPTYQRPQRYDTLEISVFDVFGIEKPSETQQMRAVKDSALEETSIAPAPQIESKGLILTQAVRIGLRIIARQHMVKLRRPGK